MKPKITARPASAGKQASRLFVLFLAPLALATIGRGQASTATPPAANPPSDHIVQMSAYQVDTSQDTGYLSKNTLSGFGIASNLMDVPSTIQIANKELIQDLGFDSPLYAVNYAAGGITRRSFNPGDDQFIWGFRAEVTLKDGIDFGQAGAGVSTMYDIDHIEIIKGPAALLFGQDAYTGGVLNYVTRQPTSTPHGEIDASYGSFDERRLEGHVSGPITKDLGYRLDIGATNSNYSDQLFSFYRDAAVSAGVVYNFSPKTRLLVDANDVTEDYLYGQTLIDPTTGRVLNRPASFTTEQPWAYYKSPSKGGTAMLTATLSEGFESRTYLGYRDFDYNWLRPTYSAINPATDTISGYATNPNISQHYVSIEQDFVKDLTTGFIHHKLEVGYEQRDDVADNQTYNYTMPAFNYVTPTYGPLPPSAPGSGAADANTNTHDRLTGIYVQDVLSAWNDRVAIVVGGRYNDYYHATGTPIVPTGQGTQAIQDLSKNVGRLGIVIHPIEHTTIYYQHSQAFIFNTNIDAYDNPLPPQTGNNDEVGAKLELFDGALVVTGSYFDLRLTNVSTNFIEPAGYPIPGAIASEALGQSVNHGGEIDLNYSKKFDLGEFDAIATVYHGNVRDNFGNKAVLPANNTNSLFGTFRFSSGPFGGFGFGAGENFQGLRDGYNFAQLNLPVVKFDAYTRLDALAFYRYQHYSLQLNVDNITDNHYVEGSEGAEWVYVNPGRAIKLSATYRY